MDCETRCCDINTQYYEKGHCVEIEEFDRCDTRKKNHRIALYVLLVITLITIFVCWYLKKKEISYRKQRLADLKVENAQDENLRITRAGTQQPALTKRLELLPNATQKNRPGGKLEIQAANEPRNDSKNGKNINASSYNSTLPNNAEKPYEDRQFFVESEEAKEKLLK